jgi:transcriptional regulator with XRE-family HTH domain
LRVLYVLFPSAAIAFHIPMETRRIAAWNIRRLRVARDQSIEALAFKAGIAAATLARIERETLNPSLDTLDVIARALGVKVAELFAPVEGGRPKPLRSGPRKGRAPRKKRKGS